MASAFGHAFTAIALVTSFRKSYLNWKFWTLGIVCSILPDADVITFKFGIPYDSFWGHRGFSHSFLFALIIGITITLIFYWNKGSTLTRLALAFYFTITTASHSLLDAMTSGGLGVALFSPWDNTRYFLPWRPIKVSPIGIDSFFSEWGLLVLKSEALWIGIPCIFFIVSVKIVKKYFCR